MSYVGRISFPGIVEPQFIKIALRTNGLRPNKALLFSKPQNNPPSLRGNLVFGFDSTTITWKNSLCDSAMCRTSRNGQQVVWTIMDGRWLHWKKFIKGAYNVLLPNGTIDPDTEKTLREIVDILFAAIGVSANTSAITSDEKPMCVFEHDRCVPELEELLELRGYVASYQLNDTYRVFRVGQGATLPNDGDVVSFSSTLNPPELPEILRALGARTRIQSKLKCKPVGMDTDGTWKDVDNLSYNPRGAGVAKGWDGLEKVGFAYITDPLSQELAKKTVGKCYRVDTQADGTHNLVGPGVDYAPGEITVTSGLQYLPVSDELVEAGVDVYGKSRYAPAYVEGLYYKYADIPPKAENSEPFTRMDSKTWKLHEELGIVEFSILTIKEKDGGGRFTFADVYLTCSYSIHDNTSHIKDRYIRDRPLSGTGMDQVSVEELERTLKCSYEPNGITILFIQDNETTVNTAADRLLDNASARYTTGLGNFVTWRGIRAYAPDGINLQVAWHAALPGSESPFSTSVSQGMEAHPLAPRSTQRQLKRIAERSNLWNTSRGRRFRNQKKGGKKK